ncbi:hypothetical protein RJ639_007650, partial [Escallonia herrerae]
RPNGVTLNKVEASQSAGSGSSKRVTDPVSVNNKRGSVHSSKRRMGSQAVASGIEDSSPWEVQKCIARFFYETGIDFSAARTPSFQRMINATVGCGRDGYQIPNFQAFKGCILKSEVKEMQQYVKEIRHSWASTGCSILLDGWVDGKGRNLINILVDCPRGPIYLRSSDISAFASDVDAMQLFFDEVLEEVGIESVVQIMTYSTSACTEAVGKRLMDKHRTVFWTVSATHCVELMLDKIGMMDLIKGILENAKSITKFIHSHAAVLKLMRNHTRGRDLVKPSKFMSAVPFLTVENMVLEKENLRKLFHSSKWNASIWASTSVGKGVAELVASRSFWTGAKMVVKATIPLVRVLDLLIEGDKHQLGYIYETIDQAKETIKEEFENKVSQYRQFWTAIDEIWNEHLHSHLHSAGYFLNPSLIYSSGFFTDPEVASGLLCCIVRMAENQDVQDLITAQVDEFRVAKGAFGEGSATNRRYNIPPALWWSTFGGECPELQRLAIRILSQTCTGASKYDLKRRQAEELLTKGRNPVEQQKLSDLTFLHYNLQLRNFEAGASNNILSDEIDPMSDWVVDAAQEMSSHDGEPTLMDLECEDTINPCGLLSGEIRGAAGSFPGRGNKSNVDGKVLTFEVVAIPFTSLVWFLILGKITADAGNSCWMNV